MADVVLRIQSTVAEGVRGVEAFKKQISATEIATADLRTTWKATTAEMVEAARRQIAVEKEKADVLRQQIVAQREVTASYKKGSEERILSAKAEIDYQRRLQVALGETATVARRAGHTARHEASRTEEGGIARGIASKSGVADAGLAGLAGPGFIIGAVIGGTLDYGVKAATEEQKAQANLANALKATGNARRGLRKETEEYAIREEHLTGFTRDDVVQSLSMLIRSTGSLAKARQDEGIMANIARARQTDLSGAYMLVLKAAMGNVGALRRLGIDVQKTTTYEDQLKAAHVTGNIELTKRAKALDLAATKTAVMAAVTSKFAGSSDAYMKTFAGRTDDLRNTWHDLFVEIGTKAIPVLTSLFAWIGKETDAARRSKAVHQALHDVVVIIKDAWDGLRIVVTAAEDLLRNKVIRTAALVAAGIWAVNAALDASPWTAIAVAALVAIGEIHKHWNGIRSFFETLWSDVKAIFFLAWDELKISAVQAVLDIIEPFSHLPGGMGKWARDMKDELHNNLDAMKRDAADQAAIIGGNAGKAMYDAFLPYAQAMAALTPGSTGATGGDPNARAQAGGTAFGLVTKAKQLGVGSGGVYRKAGGHSGVAKPGSVFDCSGYVYQVFSQNGFKGFPGTSETQWATDSGPNWTSTTVNVSDAQPGDVVFMVGSTEYASPGHVGIVTDGHGASARVMQYYSTGLPANTIALGSINDLVGIKRYYLVVKSAGGGAGPKPAPKTTTAPTTNSAFTQAVADAQRAAAAAKAAKAGLKAPSLTTIQGQIAAELKAVPPVLDAVERDAIAHIKRLRDSLHVGMPQEELAKDRVALAKWGKVLKDEIKKNADAARKAAADAKKALQAAAREAAQAWQDGWTADTQNIGRAVTESWAAVQKTFDRETAVRLKQMQRDAQAGLTQLQKAFQAQMVQFDRDTQAGLDKLGIAQTPEEKAYQDYVDQRNASDQADRLKQLHDQLSTAQQALASAASSSTSTSGGSHMALLTPDGWVYSDTPGTATTTAGSDIESLKQAVVDAQKALDNELADEQQSALQTAADASRTAADKKTAADQQAYQEQRDALKQGLQDQEDLLEQSYQDRADVAAQAYQDDRDAQWQHLNDMHDDQVTQFDADLKIWNTWLSTKQRTWAQFLAWLQQNPISKGLNGGDITNPNIAATNVNLAAAAAAASKSGDESIAAALRSQIKTHAAGGIHWRPSIGMLGDQGPEATLPLTGQRGQATIDQLASAIVRAGGAGGSGTTVYGTFLGATERQVGRALEGLVTPQQGRVVRYRAPF